MRSKQLVFYICIFISLQGAAQFKKGTKMIGASVASAFIGTGKTDYTFPNGTQGYSTHNNNRSLNLSPSIGWFLNSNSVAGLSLLVNSSYQKTWNESSGTTYKEDRNRNTDFGAGVFYRYYLSVASNLKPYAHVYVNSGSGITKTDGFSYQTTYNQTYSGKSSDRFFYNLGINAGLTKMLNAYTGLEGFVGYVYSHSKFTTLTKSVTNLNGTESTSEFQPTQSFSGNGLNIGIAFQVFLDQKRKRIKMP